MLCCLGGEALEKLQATKNAAKNCLNRALGYGGKAIEENDPKESPDKSIKEKKMEQSMLFKRDSAYEEGLTTVVDEDDDDLIHITHTHADQSYRLEVEKKPPKSLEQNQFQQLQLGEAKFDEVSLD